jgi:hypothetical protein
MAHQIKGKDSAARPASAPPSWHRLEQIIPGDITSPADIPLIACPVYSEDNTIPGYEISRPGISKRIVANRDSELIIINTASPQYRVFSNDRLLELALKAFEKNGIPAALSFAVTLDNLSKVCYSFKITSPTEFFDTDAHELFINIMNAHDGTAGCRAYGSSTRVVCNNTLQLSLRGAKEAFDYLFYHDSIGEKMLNDLPTLIEATLVNAEHYAKLREQMKNAPLNFTKARALAAALLAKKAKPSAQTVNAADGIAYLFLKGRGNEGVNVCDFLDGVTEFYTSGAGTGSAKVDAYKKMNSAEFGNGAEKKVEILNALQRDSGDFISDMELNLLVANGEKLLKEYA